MWVQPSWPLGGSVLALCIIDLYKLLIASRGIDR